MSEDEVKALLRRNIELAEDTNRVIRSMRRMAFWGGIFRFIWWIVVIVIIPALLYYYYLAPYVEQALQTYQEVQSGVHKAQGVQASFGSDPIADLKKLYEQYQAKQGQ